MSVQLGKHQLDAIEKMHNGCILCGGVGTGKSRTSIAYYFIQNGGDIRNDNYIPMSDPPKDLYIITTAKKRDSMEWEEELSAFLIHKDKEKSIYANKVTIDSWNNIKKYADVRDSFFIFDEQRVIGSGAWVKAFLKIAKSNEWILLSATPGDTYMDYCPVFIANGYFKNKTEFIREHVIYKRFSKFPQIDRYVGTNRLNRLRKNVLVTMKFERKTERHHIDIQTLYDKAQYRTMMRERWNIWKDQPIETASELCQCLRKIVNTDISKLYNVSELCDKHERVIIFYNYNYELELLKGLPYKKGTEIAEWNGNKHQSIPENNRWVYLVQYNAGAEGWNCIRTNVIIFYSPNYSYRIMEQSAGRIDRMNTQYFDLYYYHLVSKSPIDMAIKKAIREKKKFNESIFVGEK